MVVGEYMIGLVAQNWLIWIRYASARPADTWSLGHDYFGLIAFQAVGRRRRLHGLKISLQRWYRERGRVTGVNAPAASRGAYFKAFGCQSPTHIFPCHPSNAGLCQN